MLVLYCFKVYRCMNKTHEKRQGRENKFSKILSNNQITACRIELRVQEMTMN